LANELESTTQAKIRQAVNLLPYARLVRNNTGKVKTADGKWITYGLGNGGADLVGWVTMHNGLARVLCIEVKRPKGGKVAADQIAWLTSINKHGGAGAICRSAEQAVEFAERARDGEFFTGAGPFQTG